MSPRVAIAGMFVLISGGLILLLGLISCQLLSSSLNQQLDHQLHNLSTNLAPEVEFKDGTPELRVNDDDKPPSSFLLLATIQVFDRSGKLVLQDGRVGPPTVHPGMGDVNVSQTHMRAFSRAIPNDKEPKAWLQISVLTEERDKAISSYTHMMGLFAPVALLLLCFGGYYFSGVIISPIESSLEQLRRLVADIGHELRTPVTIALSNVQALDEELKESNVDNRRVSAVERAILRMGSLVEDLLFLARSEVPSQAFKAVPTDVSELAVAVAEDFSEEFSRKNVSIRCQVEKCRVNCDPDAMRRVLQNLIENALKYTPAGGRVDIKTTRQGKQSVITVEDTGVGIPSQFQKRIFDRFYRVDSSRSRHKGGAGLGLAIVRTIVDAHGGRVTVNSVEGKGTSFAIELPAFG